MPTPEISKSVEVFSVELIDDDDDDDDDYDDDDDDDDEHETLPEQLCIVCTHNVLIHLVSPFGKESSIFTKMTSHHFSGSGNSTHSRKYPSLTGAPKRISHDGSILNWYICLRLLRLPIEIDHSCR